MSYSDVVTADSPEWYCRMNEISGGFARSSGSDTRVGLVAGQPSSLGSAGGHIVWPNYTGVALDGGAFLLGQEAQMWLSAGTSGAVTVFTFEGWFAVASAVFGGLGQTRHIWEFMGTPAADWVALYDVKNNLTIQVQDSGSTNHTGTYQTTPGLLQDGNFHHVVLAVGASSTVLYVDGVALSPALTLTPASWDYNPAEHGQNFLLGQNSPAITNHAGIFYTEIAFYTTALSSGQVAAHYAAREVTTRPRPRQGLATGCP